MNESGVSERRPAGEKREKRQVSINLDMRTIEYFKRMAISSGIPYQTLINLYLSDCASSERKVTITWN